MRQVCVYSRVNYRFQVDSSYTCGLAKTMQKRYDWTRVFLKTEKKKLRFQTNTDTCGQGVNRAIQRQRNVYIKCAARAKFVLLLFRLNNFFVCVESFAFSPGIYYENLFFFIGACRVPAVSPLSNTSDGLRCGSAMVEQV